MRKALMLCAVAATVCGVMAAAASPAMALPETTLCETEHMMTHECPFDQYPAHAVYEAAGKAVIFANPLELKCKSRMVFETLAQAAPVIEAEISTFEISGCTNGGVSCAATLKNAPFKGKITYSAEEDGHFEIESGGSGGPEFSLPCSPSCTFTVSSIPAAIGGGPTPPPFSIPAEIDMEASLTKTAGTCKSPATFGDSLEFTKPTHVYVEKP